ncbi:hypothetical protein F0267_02005 [Vibrio coralliilyticus]|uniref:Uncharacterized protein n=3 Tax=Vibrio TaxID=662 RepID=A0AAN0SK10_9VIBR|nr:MULTISPECIES: hypothetical protein [Vibrio]CAH1587735.1 conserved hypothetical protein [Vibrio jasicida]AIW22438.1 hypothetical protein IX92_25570 [Vibrio coralliilyticus]MCZ2799098.1 hypothetical protein [Vibrio alginolyticus]NOH36999.1 hypothetical protein [Vibrio coralliilyticus]PAW02515.1 hypothetical protein CKJ79_17775 [Vibrio coralliilyticus]
MLNWLIFSLPTTIAYTYECFGLFAVSRLLYLFPVRFNYPPALFHLGHLHISCEIRNASHEEGIRLIKLAAVKGYKPASEWLEKFKPLVDASNESAKKSQIIFKELTSGLFRNVKIINYIIAFLFHLAIAIAIYNHL